MREILFKAKRIYNNEWCFGYLIEIEKIKYILPIGDPLNQIVQVIPETVGQYTNIDIKREAWPTSEVHKIFTGDMLGDWGEDEDGNECVCILGVVTYWESEGRYVLADENGFCNDHTLEDYAQPENWPHLIHCGNINDKEDSHDE